MNYPSDTLLSKSYVRLWKSSYGLVVLLEGHIQHNKSDIFNWSNLEINNQRTFMWNKLIYKISGTKTLNEPLFLEEKIIKHCIAQQGK